ncbi:MAG: FecR domain-containing protein [Rhodospirillaceae bacterium]
MRRLFCSVSIAAFALGAPFGAFAQEIGSVAAVNRDIEGTPPGTPSRALLLGDRLISNERLVSSPNGSGQMLFLDQTSLTVSPNSDITLDKYVYDPDSETGEIGVTVARGVMRMIGGRITKSNDATVETPTATIGIRGGIALIAVGEDDTTRVMHVAGEFTRISTAGQALNLTRPNGFAMIGPGGAPEYLGVASEADIAALYNQMQGGGGGSDQEVTDDDAEQSGVAGENSEAPGVVFSQPISTSGERPVGSNFLEVEQLTLTASPDVAPQFDEEVVDGGVTPTPEPEPEPVNPFADFVGGALVVDGSPFTDDDGVTVANAAQSNFLFADTEGADAVLFEPGSLIITFENGDQTVLPTPEGSGVFEVSFNQTESPIGQLSGAGYADFEAGLFLFGLRTRGDELVGVFGANPGPTQLRNLNSGSSGYGVTSFEIMPDLAISEPGGTAQPFLPIGLGEQFDTGERTRLYLISRPNQPLFTAGTADYSAGARLLIPQFSISGTGENQRYLFHVGATGVANNGSGAPSFSSFGRGSFRLNGFGPAATLRPFTGTTEVGDDARTVFGSGDNYLLLGNEGAFALNDDAEPETAASGFDIIGTPEADAYGNLHLAQRGGTEAVNPATRLGFGATAAAFRNETGFTDAPNDAHYLSFGYSSGVGAFRDSTGLVTEKYQFRTAAISSPSAAAKFDTNTATGAIVVDLDEASGGTGMDVFGARLFFGGNRSAVIDGSRFGMRDHQDPGQLSNVLVFSGGEMNYVDTAQGRLTGRAPDQFSQSAFRGGIIGSELVDASSLYPSGTPLKPNYLSWGWWTGNFRFSENDPGQFQNGRLQFSLGTWIAGDRTDVLPTSGAATYTGAVTVNNVTLNGADFVDGGRFNMNFDFGSRTGQAQFQNVLSLPNFSVPVNDGMGAIGANDYGGATIIQAGGDPTNVRVDGSFFDGPQANDARATAGSIRLQNNSGSINATGTYWGER